MTGLSRLGSRETGRTHRERPEVRNGGCDRMTAADLPRHDPDDAEAAPDGMIERFTPDIAARVRACRAALRRRLPHVVELVYDNHNALAIGHAPAERPLEGVVSLAIYPRTVLLYFLHGASLAGPDGLLQGAACCRGTACCRGRAVVAGTCRSPAPKRSPSRGSRRCSPARSTRCGGLSIRR